MTSAGNLLGERVPDAGARSRSSSDAVFDELRSDILAGVYAPGSKLKFAQLGNRYQASVSVLREALSRLTEQQLVDSEPRVGFRVKTLSVEDLRDLTWTRIQIETVALREAMQKADVAWESTLLAAHHQLERTPMLTDEAPARIRDDWETAHAAFHRAVIAGCDSVWLTGIADNLRDCSELYRRWSGAREPGRDVPAEHRRILEGVLAHDPDEAVEALADHYGRTLQILEAELVV